MANSALNSSIKFTLNNGVQMPAVGLGTYRIRACDSVFNALDHALGAGYRLIDTAAVYSNEQFIGDALKVLLPKYGLNRDDIFITTKLAPSDHGDSRIVSRAYSKSIDNLGLDYVDLYLIHFPGTARMSTADKRNTHIRHQTWAAFKELYEDGKVNAIGVSNFTVRHLKELTMDQDLVPSVNQVEFHPYYSQTELLKYCKENEIQLQAYCSFGGTSLADQDLMEEPIVKSISSKRQLTPAQVLLLWALQQDVAVIPKSTHPGRLLENISLSVKLSDEDMALLHTLGHKKRKYAWDPEPVC